jgi:putative photosynthetic complex assembly protein
MKGETPMNASTQDLLRDRYQTRKESEGDKIPKGLLIAMFLLAMSALVIVSYAVLTGRPHEGQPAEAAILHERTVILEGHGAKAVTVRDENGALLADLAHGGFVTVIQNGLERARTVGHADQTKPVRLIAYANGRLTIIDPETGWTAELGAFGSDNRAAFERLMTK